MSNNIKIILVNYKNYIDTIDCLISILKNNYLYYQIFVIDNHSENESIFEFKKWSNENSIDAVFLNENSLKNEAKIENKIVFIESNSNLGFSGGNNIGIRYLLRFNDFNYVWILNSDTIIEYDTLTSMYDFAKNNKCHITGSVLKYDTNLIQAYGGCINKFTGKSSHIINKFDLAHKLDYIVGASMLISKDTIEILGLLPEEYFLYYEEVDYCFNARKKGLNICVAENSVVYHKEGGSVGGGRGMIGKSEFIDLLSLENRIKFHKKYLGGGIGLIFGLLLASLNRIRRMQFKRAIKVLFLIGRAV